MPQHVCIALTAEQREHLLKFTTTGTAKVRAVTRARILLLADMSEGQRLTAKDIATSLECSQGQVARVCHRFAEEGLEAALFERPREGGPPKITGDIEAELVLLACSDPPDGRKR